MKHSFFFYDLETSGVDMTCDRIMQFAGQRTNLELKPIGPPVNVLVRLSDDVLPNPLAIAITGITPQQASRGMNEAEFVAMLQRDVCTPGTIMTGYNSVRFDDEFLRYTLYRNLADPYEWAWKDGRARWDLLDVVRMTRALRPDGIEWPKDNNGDAVNTLVSLSGANHLVHTRAHDALSDVEALIAMSVLIRKTQPKLFNYLLKLKDKREVLAVVKPFAPEPFVYTSVMYGRAYGFTTVAVAIGEGENNAVITYDLRHDPDLFVDLSEDELAERIFAKTVDLEAKKQVRPPVKNLHANKCPAVAPLGTLDAEAATRLDLSLTTVSDHLTKLRASGLVPKLVAAMKLKREYPPHQDVDGALYDGGFMSDADKQLQAKLRGMPPEDLAEAKPTFADKRLPELFWRYRARNYPDTLTEGEQALWDTERSARLQGGLKDFTRCYQGAFEQASPEQASALEDLRLWVESIFPVVD